MPSLSDEMGAKLVNILAMMARETLRSRLRNSEQAKKELLSAYAAQKDISKASKLDWTLTGFKSRAGAELMLRDLKRLQPELFENARIEGRYLIHPDLPVVEKAIKELSKDRSIVAVAIKEPEEEPYLRSVDEGDVSKVIVGDEHTYRDALNAQYFSTILEDNDIDAHVEKNAIVIPHEDLKAAEAVLEKENERVIAMGPDRAEQFLRQRFKDRLGVEFDGDMKVVDNPVKGDHEGKDLEGNLEQDGSLDHAGKIASIRSELEERGIETYDSKLGDFSINPDDHDKVKAFMDEKGLTPADVKVAMVEHEHERGEFDKVQPADREQAQEIEQEVEREREVGRDGKEAERGENADERLSRETRMAERREDIANVKTTADCVQARPDANSQDISTPYADGQDAPGTGDIDGDGVQDSAEDRDGDGVPDEWDPDEDYIDDDPDYEPVSMKERGCDELLMDKEAEAKFVESREAARGEKDVSLQTEAR